MEILGALFAIIVVIALIGGAVQTFQRNWILAILMLIFVFPFWVLWALIEMFLPSPKEKVIKVEVKNT